MGATYCSAFRHEDMAWYQNGFPKGHLSDFEHCVFHKLQIYYDFPK